MIYNLTWAGLNFPDNPQTTHPLLENSQINIFNAGHIWYQSFPPTVSPMQADTMIALGNIASAEQQTTGSWSS